MIKIKCPYCGEIIETDTTDDKLYCPKCFKNISIEQGKKHLSTYISKNLELAKKELNVSTEYEKAYDDFTKVIEVVADDYDAATGLVLSSLLISTVRINNLKKSMEELSKYQDILQFNQIDIEHTVHFVILINDYLNIYVDTLYERLSNKGHFYEEKGKDIYITAVNDAINYKRMLIDLYLSKRKISNKYPISETSLNNEIDKLESKKNEHYKIKHNPLHLLDVDIKECRIKDIVFKDVRKVYKNRNVSLVWAIIFLAIFAAGISLIFSLPKRLLIGVPVCAFGFIGSLIFLIVFFTNRNKLSK